MERRAEHRQRLIPTGPRFRDSYGVLFFLLIAIMVLLAIAGESPWGRAIMLVALSASTWVALRASQVERLFMRLAVAAIPVATAVAVALLLLGDDHLTRIVSGVLLLLLVVASPLAITRHIAQRPSVSVNTFFAAISVYLLAAMFFATLYPLIAEITGQPFFVQTATPLAVDYLYFSFVTITTTGYGDFTAASGLGKMLANIEGIIGQLYLITVVALVVQNLGLARQVRLQREHVLPEGASSMAEDSGPAPGEQAGEEQGRGAGG